MKGNKILENSKLQRYYYDREPLALDSFFQNSLKKIDLYREQNNTISNLNEKELSSRHKKIRAKYKLKAETIKSYDDRDSRLEEIDFMEQYDYFELKNSINEKRDYFNKSSLLILYSMFEGDLRHICFLLQDAFKTCHNFNDSKKSNFFKNVMTYLKEVIELNTESLEKYSRKLDELRYLRNKITHESGRFNKPKSEGKNINGTEIVRIINNNREYLELVEENENGALIIKIKSAEYIDYYYSILILYLRDFLWLIDEKLKYAILSSRITLLFSRLDHDLNVNNFKILNENNRCFIECDIVLSDTHEDFRFKCEIVILESDRNDLVINSKVNTFPMLNHMIDYIDYNKGYYRSKLLESFWDQNLSYSVTVKISS